MLPEPVLSGRRLILRLLSALEPLPALLTRVAVGHAFFVTGAGKLLNFERTVGFFAELGIPMPELNAHFVARLEYYGGLLLIVGLATRLLAGLLSSTMVVAMLTADRQEVLSALSFSGEVGLTDVTPFVFFVLLAWLAVRGPGLVSADAVLARALSLEATPAPTTAPAPASR